MSLLPDHKSVIRSGGTALGIEFGSTRIKASLVTLTGEPVATGVHEWENQMIDGHWSYSLVAIWEGISSAYVSMLENCKDNHGVVPETYSSSAFLP